MSKIIEALEKANREGRLESTAVALDERATAEPLHAGPAARPRVTLKHRPRSYLRETVAVDPSLLGGVDRRIDTLHAPMSVVSEQYRQVRSRLERPGAAGEIRTLAVTSAVKGEGKSLTAVNLAVVMAQNKNRQVILLDADFRRPNVHRLLGLDVGPGLADYLQGAASREEVIHETPFFGLSVITAGNTEGHPAELLASPEFASFVSDCRAAYDYVVIDTPPVHPISDVNFLVEFVDGVVLVVRAGRTGVEIVRRAVGALPEGKIVGAVLNRADELGAGYGYRRAYYAYDGKY